MTTGRINQITNFELSKPAERFSALLRFRLIEAFASYAFDFSTIATSCDAKSIPEERRRPSRTASSNRRSGPRPLHRFSTTRPCLSHSHPAEYNTIAQLPCLRSMCARRSTRPLLTYIATNLHTVAVWFLQPFLFRRAHYIRSVLRRLLATSRESSLLPHASF